MFHLQGITKIYRKRRLEVTAFRADELNIAKGEYVAVVGPSGSGKTTLLSLLGGMLSPDSGQVLFEGASLYDLPLTERTKLRRERIGFVFQTFNSVHWKTCKSRSTSQVSRPRDSATGQRRSSNKSDSRTGWIINRLN
jgi:putative ABC transport system ATP-binding protein